MQHVSEPRLLQCKSIYVSASGLSLVRDGPMAIYEGQSHPDLRPELAKKFASATAGGRRQGSEGEAETSHTRRQTGGFKIPQALPCGAAHMGE